MSSKQYAADILKELERTLIQLDDAELQALAKQLLAAERVL